MSQSTQTEPPSSFHGFSQEDYERTRSEIQRMLNSHGIATGPSSSPTKSPHPPTLPKIDTSPPKDPETQDTRSTAVGLLGLGTRPADPASRHESSPSPVGAKGSLDRFLSGDKVRHGPAGLAPPVFISDVPSSLLSLSLFSSLPLAPQHLLTYLTTLRKPDLPPQEPGQRPQTASSIIQISRRRRSRPCFRHPNTPQLCARVSSAKPMI